ncbi:MAG TPA: hypothetical protein VH593_01560, partial [Ktedonobacteraceae bacterium]
MAINIEMHTPQARCGVCGSPQVVSICHHCGQPACKEDTYPAVDRSGRPLSHEFEQLGLDQKGPHHCDDCAHMVKGRLKAFAVAGLVLALTGIVVTVVDLLVGMSFFVAGAGLAGVMYPADKRRLLTALDARPAVPVVATITSVRVVESMRGSLRLDQAGNYETSVEPVEGEIEISMALSRTDRERLRRYMKRYLLADKSQLEYSAGFAALRGQTKLVLVDQNLDRISVIAEPTVIPLRGMVSAFPYLNSADSPSAAPWTMQAHYHLPEGCGVDA